jgi:hypothetical protein
VQKLVIPRTEHFPSPFWARGSPHRTTCAACCAAGRSGSVKRHRRFAALTSSPDLRRQPGSWLYAVLPHVEFHELSSRSIARGPLPWPVKAAVRRRAPCYRCGRGKAAGPRRVRQRSRWYVPGLLSSDLVAGLARFSCILSCLCPTPFTPGVFLIPAAYPYPIKDVLAVYEAVRQDHPGLFIGINFMAEPVLQVGLGSPPIISSRPLLDAYVLVGT